MHICIYTCIPKSNLFHLYNVTSMYVSELTFWHQKLIWYTLLLGWPLLTPSFLWSPVVLCIGIRLPGFPPSSLAGSWVSLLFNSHLGSFVAETLWTKFLMLIRDTMLEQSPWSSSSYNHSAPSLAMTPEPWVLAWPVDVSFGNGLLWVCLIY